MTVFDIRLEARLPARNLARAYHVAVSQDLFGVWVVDITFGRIGAPGRSKRYAVADLAAARPHLRRILRRRLSAPRRLGASYRCQSVFDPMGWLAQDGLLPMAA